jgi:hypothetical protein
MLKPVISAWGVNFSGFRSPRWEAGVTIPVSKGGREWVGQGALKLGGMGRVEVQIHFRFVARSPALSSLRAFQSRGWFLVLRSAQRTRLGSANEPASAAQRRGGTVSFCKLVLWLRKFVSQISDPAGPFPK